MSYSVQAATATRFSNPDTKPLVAGRLLIVDDLADNRAILTRRFQRRGFEIVEADSGPEALRLVEEQSFDCVLLDVMMPEMSGTEVLQEIRVKFSASLLPIIMVTAKSQSEDIVEALKFGANDYVTKPVDFSTALARVNSQIQRGRADLEIVDANKFLSSETASLQRQSAERGAELIHVDAAIRKEIARRITSEDQIAYLAHTDRLTGLPNRFTFEQKLEALGGFQEELGSRISLLFVDLDGFKNVNDTLGHGIGDGLLKQVAARVTRTVGANDFCARLGGDEFAIIHVSEDPATTAPRLAENVISAIGGAHVVEGNQIYIGASVGIAILDAGGKDVEGLLRQADLAMYRAKADGRGVFRLFEPEMAIQAEQRRRLESDLRKAMLNGEIHLKYQPIIDLTEQRVTGFEALMRWQHPVRGMVSPAEFIPLAEDTGLIVAMGEWAIHKACADAMTWPGDLRVAINISPVQFAEMKLLTAVVNALTATGLPANRLELEVTERAIQGNNKKNILVLRRLREFGARISLDDFGVGFSGLDYFRSCKFDKVKIDRSLVREMRDSRESLAIIRAAIGLGANLGISATAGGVENLDQLDNLMMEGCTEVQGFLFSRPKSSDDVPEMIEEIGRALDGRRRETSRTVSIMN
jgi:diguanylate cyclase (GGDEF)-like protein